MPTGSFLYEIIEQPVSIARANTDVAKACCVDAARISFGLVIIAELSKFQEPRVTAQQRSFRLAIGNPISGPRFFVVGDIKPLYNLVSLLRAIEGNGCLQIANAEAGAMNLFYHCLSISFLSPG